MVERNDDLWTLLLIVAGIGIGFIVWEFLKTRVPAFSTIYAGVPEYPVRPPFPQYYNTTPPVGYYAQVAPAPQPKPQETVSNDENISVEYNADGSVKAIHTTRNVKSVV